MRTRSITALAPLLPLLAAAAPSTALAQVVSCTAISGDKGITLALSHRGQDASRALLSRMEPAVAAAVDALERGLLAEMGGRSQPPAFGDALQKLQEVEAAARALDEAHAAMQAAHKQDRPLATFEDALKKILRDRPLGPSRGLRGASRYVRAGSITITSAGTDAGTPTDAGTSSTGGGGSGGGGPVRTAEEPASLEDILRMQRADLAEVRRAFSELADALRGAMAGGKGVAAASLAGRVPLLSAAQAAVERWEAFRAFSLESCRATQAAVMQVYPNGMEWLEEPQPPR